MRIYFSGISGFGIGPLAMIAKDMGHEILGSDINISPVSDSLIESGVEVSYSQDGSFFEDQHKAIPIDLFVYTSALPKEHAELAYANKNGITAVKRDGLINKLVTQKGLKTMAVAGTHGKTTTTAMLVWVLQSLGVNIAHSIGTTTTFAPSGRYEPKSKVFIYEADEYDRNFLKFKPFASIITSVDYDHSDTYPTPEDYEAAFAEFMSQSEHVTMWDDDVNRFNIEKTGIDVLSVEKYQHNLKPNMIGITLLGEHNRMNATLAAKFIVRHFIDTDLEQIVKIINKYPGSSRRFEQLVPNLYTDYAHHPIEIKATLQLANELSNNVVAVYQPHQNLRQRQLMQIGGYSDSFDAAEKIYWLPTFTSREDKSDEMVTLQEIMSTFDKEINIVESKLDDELKKAIDEHLKKGTIVLAMSAGDLDGWLRDRYLGLEDRI